VLTNIDQAGDAIVLETENVTAERTRIVLSTIAASVAGIASHCRTSFPHC
jgi:hypothetical protein